MTTQTLPAPAVPRRLRVAESAGYVLTGFPLAVAAFVLMIVGVSVSLGTLVITIGFGVLAVTLGIARLFARIERARMDALFHSRTPRPHYREPQGGRLGRALSAGADPRRWLDLLHGIIAFPIAVATFVVVVAWFAAAVSGIGAVFWEWSIPRGDDNHSLAYFLGLGDGRAADTLLMTGLGVLFALTFPFVVRGCAALQAGVAWALLADHGED
ncbi:MAG TPA: sensor domain-containing protein [Mycobacteriales bacterium]|jgi:hypothetical protein|nr:sensor domain-containing protein [Mycobacteriales bacterium]